MKSQRLHTPSEICLKMIVEHRTLVELTRTVAKTARNDQHGIFFPSAVALKIKKLFKNIETLFKNSCSISTM